jgi:hypothetical protein
MLKQVIEMYELLDDAHVSGDVVKRHLEAKGVADIKVERIAGERGSTDFIRIAIPGTAGKSSGGDKPTLGIIGRLGGIGARPERIGLVSDADGAVAALACAAKLADMATRGDRLAGDVIIATHICPDAPTSPHVPVAFMGSPVDMASMNAHEVDPAMEAILSIDTTKGNRIINHRGFAISPTVMQGYILKPADDLLDIVEWSSGQMPWILPLSTQDITPYGNGLFHVNSILQPCTATKAPVVGVAITAVRPVPGCGTGASRETDIEEAARFCLEVAKSFTAGACRFHDADEFAAMKTIYGSMEHLQRFDAASKED